jgi:hypothetical protein
MFDEAEAPIPVIVPMLAPVEPPIGFHNPFAVRLGLFVALAADFLVLMPYLFYGFPLWLVAGGFLCVYLYTRRTGHALSVRSGARLGWITGVFSFAIFTLLFTINFVSELGSGNFQKTLHERLAQMPLAHDDVAQFLRIIESPAGLATYLFFMLAFLFVLFTAFPVAGGALGAKMLNKKD